MNPYLAAYAQPVGTAAEVFPLLVLITLVPFAVWHYHRHGRVHPWRALVSYSFVFYFLAACFLVLLPLPPLPDPHQTEAWIAAHSRVGGPRLDPLGFATDILSLGPGVTRNRAILQAAFNGVLLLPLGFYLVYAFRWRWWAAALGGLGFSLLLELSQLTGLFWFYPAPYRLFDAGDLVLNGSGALLGAVLARLLVATKALPALESLAAPNTPWIGPFRRAIAVSIDGALAWATVVLGSLEGPLVAVPLAFWLVLVPVVDVGRGPGRRVTLCALQRSAKKLPSRWRVLARQSLLWGPFCAALALPALPVAQALLVLAGLLLHLWSLVGILADPEKAGPLDRWLGLRVRNTWANPPAPNPSSPAKGKKRK